FLDGVEDEAAEGALLNASYELLASWQLEESLAKEGILPASRDTEAVLDGLLANNRELRRTLEGLNAKLKAPGIAADSMTLGEKIERLQRAKQDAELRAALIPVERDRAAQARKASDEARARAAALEERLRAAEAKLQRSESALRETKAAHA